MTLSTDDLPSKKDGPPPLSSKQLRDLSRLMRQASTFEDAAQLFLSEAHRVASCHVLAMGARVIRVAAHLRPSGSYAGLAVYPADHSSHPNYSSSATAWHAVALNRQPVLIDVAAKTVLNESGHTVTTAHSSLSFRSRDSLLAREAQFIIAVPLHRPGGHLNGFVAYELAAKEARLNLAEWPRATPDLELLGDLASPYLSALPKSHSTPSDDALPVVGAAMKDTLHLLRRVARDGETILLYGETGVGKTRLAQWIHQLSSSASRPFEVISLAAVPAHLQAAHLFGVKKGAFTGADTDRAGVVEAAAGGTLFIDEINKLSIEGQKLILGLFDDGNYHRVGDPEVHHADIRLIVASTENLEDAVKEGRFLSDLYYRLATFPVLIPALRARSDEIGEWAQYLLSKLQEKSGSDNILRLGEGAVAALRAQPWPGNIRQLHNIMKRVRLLATEDPITPTITITRDHIDKALSLGSHPHAPSALIAKMNDAAAAFVAAAQSAEGALRLVNTRAFKWFTIECAITLLGEKGAYKLLAPNRISSSNYKKDIHQARRRLIEFKAMLGGESVPSNSPKNVPKNATCGQGQ